MNQIITSKAPRPAGHYSQAWTHNGIVFVSGQLPVNPETEKKCLGSAAEQAEQALNNVKGILEAAGSNVEKVLKLTIYVSDVELWDEVNEACKKFFRNHKPARAIVPTSNLHYGFKVEIEAVAAV